MKIRPTFGEVDLYTECAKSRAISTTGRWSWLVGGVNIVYTCQKRILSDGDIIIVRKRHRYTTGYKLTVVEFAEKTNNCAAQRKFGVRHTLT